MFIFRCLCAVAITLTMYSLLSLVWGASGIIAYEQLNTEKSRMEANEQKLIIRNKYLQDTKKSLQTDHDILTRDARKLGYGKPDEKYIRIEGFGFSPIPNMEAGDVVYAETPESVPDTRIKVISIFAGLLFLACSFIFYGRQQEAPENAPFED